MCVRLNHITYHTAPVRVVGGAAEEEPHCEVCRARAAGRCERKGGEWKT